MRIPRAAIAVSGLVVALAGCSSPPATPGPDDGRLTIVTDIYPVAYAAQMVGGDAVEVLTLTAPGVEPHDLELTATQVKQIASADLVAYVPGLIAAITDAIDQQAADRAIDATSGIERLNGHEGGDPHVWMDPTNVTLMGTAIAAALAERAPGTTWSTDALAAEMAALDQEFTDALASCTITPLVVSHEAFGYLAAAYGFEQHGISGLSPEAEPSPATMKQIADLVRAQGVTTIYYEALVSPKAAEAIAAETGARTALLDPIETSTGGRSYDTLMRENLSALRAGQGCAP